jgi:serine/threonine-protein kinase
VLNAGREGGFYFLIRRFVDGDSLDTLISRRGRLPELEALNIITQVAEGLAAAHACGVIHRDVKPGNIIVAPDGRAKLIDFGLARPLGPGDVSSSGEVIGTPYYMAPEQCDGEVLDPRADIYSLGATFYHMLAGVTPFAARSVLELLRKQIYEEPVPVRKLNPEVSESVERIVARMMAKNRQERHPTARALLEELTSIRSRLHRESSPPA